MNKTALLLASISVFLLAIITSCRKDAPIELAPPCDSDCSCDGDSLSLFSPESGQEFIYDSIGRLVSYYTPSHPSYGSNNTFIEWTYSGDRLVNLNKGGFHGENLSFDYTGNTAEVQYWAELTTPATYTLVVDDNGFALAYSWHSNPANGDSATYHYSPGSLLPDSVVYYGNGLSWPEKLYYTNGLLTQAVRYNSDGAQVHTKEYFYDESGNWIKYVSGSQERQYFYNCCGQLIHSVGLWNGTDTLCDLDYQQTRCDDMINMNPVNYYRYPYMRMPMPY